MPKASKQLTAVIKLNPEKGGAWLSEVLITKFDGENEVTEDNLVTAWKNASAAKRWVKAMVQEHTPRKSVKMNATQFNDLDKPTAFKGELQYKE